MLLSSSFIALYSTLSSVAEDSLGLCCSVGFFIFVLFNCTTRLSFHFVTLASAVYVVLVDFIPIFLLFG